MKKLGTVIRYECVTSFKYLWIFYAIQYAIVAVIFALSFISTGNTEKIDFSCLEINSIIYVGFLGVFGYKEDFRMLIQNGFTRKYIFLATFTLFAFISGIMSLIDSIIGIGFHFIRNDYDSIFGGLYGYGHSFFLNWIWLFLIYMFICCLFYLAILVINRFGTKLSLYAGIILGFTIILIIPSLLKFVFPEGFTAKIIAFGVKAIGFMADGTINFLYPVLLLMLTACILSSISYYTILRTELKA